MDSNDRLDRTEAWKLRWIGFVDAVYEPLERAWLGLRSSWEAARPHPAVVKFLVVFGSVGAATVIGTLFPSAVSVQSQLLLYLPAVLLSAMFGGVLLGVVASGLGVLGALGLHPAGQADQGLHEAVAVLLYLMASAMIVGLARVQEIQKQQIQAFARQLEERVQERTADLLAANKELDSFCYSISHDIRTPMRSIVSHSRIILEDLGDKLDEEGRQNLDSIANSANKLAELVDDLLHYARVGHLSLEPEWVDLTAVCDEIAAQLRTNDWPLPAISFKIQPGMTVAADRVLLRLAIHNLLENACKYAKKDQTLMIEVSEKRQRNGSVFCVKDNGIGIEMQYAEKVFEPFYRLHRDVDYPGTGIGLANVRRIIERHGGRIWVESKLDTGTTFFFTLAESKSRRISSPARS